MNAKYLDFLLEVLKAKHPQSMLYTEFVCTPNVHSDDESKARDLLVKRGFIFDANQAHSYIGITGEGLLFLNQGGFQKEEELKNLPFVTVKAAKSSKKLSIIAIIISIIAIVVRLIWH